MTDTTCYNNKVVTGYPDMSDFFSEDKEIKEVYFDHVIDQLHEFAEQLLDTEDCLNKWGCSSIG